MAGRGLVEAKSLSDCPARLRRSIRGGCFGTLQKAAVDVCGCRVLLIAA